MAPIPSTDPSSKRAGPGLGRALRHRLEVGAEDVGLGVGLEVADDIALGRMQDDVVTGAEQCAVRTVGVDLHGATDGDRTVASDVAGLAVMLFEGDERSSTEKSLRLAACPVMSHDAA